MDKRKNNGGVRDNAGRKPKSDEIALIEKLTPMHPAALKAIEIGVKNGEYNFVKLFMEYFHGKPKETVQMDQELVVIVKKVKRSEIAD